MPVMVRPKGKGAQVAFDVIGVPQNLKKRRKRKKDRWINDKLTAEETSRVR